jgi:ketosteroid isomerase-like protein
MKIFKSLIFLTTLSLVSSYVTSASDENYTTDTINSAWENSFSQGNTDVLMTLYTDNAVVFSPSSEIFDGRAEIKDYLSGLKSVGVISYTISNVEIEIKGDLAYETAQWEAIWSNAEGSNFNFEGNISNVFEKQKDGSWKIKFQSWN